MSSEIQITQQELIPAKLKDELQELGFVLSATIDSGVMWGFDGSTKYFPRKTFMREKVDDKPKIKLRIEKTTNGFTLIINSIPFKPRYHLNRYELAVAEIVPILKEYIDLI